jgi:hypothetical protein
VKTKKSKIEPLKRHQSLSHVTTTRFQSFAEKRTAKAKRGKKRF